MTKKYRSPILAAVHETVSDMYDIGLVDKATMRKFDKSCLTLVEPFAPHDVVALRERENVSQAVLARHLNVAVKLVGEWERGEKKPSGPSLKLLSLVKAKGLGAIA